MWGSWRVLQVQVRLFYLTVFALFHCSCPALTFLTVAGKSLVVLALACLEDEKRSETQNMMRYVLVTGKTCASQNFLTRFRDVRLTSGSSLHVELPKLPTTSLIVVPDFLTQQWGSYVRQFTTLPLNQHLIMTSKRDVEVFAHKTLEEQRVYSVIIATPEVYQLVSPQFHMKRVVFDEIGKVCVSAVNSIFKA